MNFKVDHDGTQKWYKNGELHCDNDLPAVTKLDGTALWYKDGKLHRDNDRPAIVYPTGDKE